MPYDDWVEWRLANGSMCGVCPLNGQRKVGCVGDPDAGPVMILEAPGAEEESYNAAHQKYGVPIVGRSGWALKFKLLAPVGLIDIEQKEGQWPKVKKWNVFVMNRIMCRPPNNKINSPEGKKALACCSNSAKSLMAYLLARNPDRAVIASGGTALDLLTGQATIGPYRGRVLNWKNSYVTPMPQDSVLKIALRGVKPPAEAEPYLKILKLLLSKSRSSLKAAPLRQKKALEKEALSLAKPYLTLLSTVLTRQRKTWSQAKSV